MGTESSTPEGIAEKNPLEDALTQMERCIKIKAQIEEDIQLSLRKLQGLCEQLGSEKLEESRIKTKVQVLRDKGEENEHPVDIEEI